MRISTIAAALVLLLPAVAGAQTKPPVAPPPQPATQPAAQPAPTVEEPTTGGWTGWVDVGVRGTSLDGDGARYERYRDLSDGLFLERFRVSRDTGRWLFDVDGEHVGRRDQRFVGTAVAPGKLKASFTWDQIPMLFSRTTRSLFTGIGTGGLLIDDALQTQVQAAPSTIATVFALNGREFDTRTRRHLADGAAEYFASEVLTFRTNYRRTTRRGTIPFGGSFGHSSVVELPAPTNHDLSEFSGEAEYSGEALLVRAGYNGSWFHNNVTSLVFENPYRATDIAGTPSRGRLTLPPSNSFVGVNGLASVKLPHRSRATAYVSVGLLKDAGDALVPQTINSALSPAPVQRSTVEGEAGTSSVNLTFVSRPKQFTDLTLRYKTYNYNNRTPEMALSQRVSYDNALSAVSPPIHTEPYGLSRDTFDADFRLIPRGRTSAGVGYTRNAEERNHRIFESTLDHTVRFSFDAMTRQWFSVRSKYEHSQRRGKGIEQGEQLLASIAEQPKLRHFDIANRDRDRVTVIGSVTPTQFMTASLTFAAGKDDYLESIFGLRDNTHQVYGLGADFAPGDRVTAGVSYSFEEYNALQRSRQANPGAQFNDPSRNWAADSSDRTHSVLLNAGVARIAERVDLNLSYDFTRGRARYNYITGPVPDRTLPEEVLVPTTLPTPTELPPTLSEFHRATADVRYALNRRLSVGVSYWYDQYRVSDFTLDIDANPQLARGQALLMGYLYRPYTANTGWVRLFYRW